MKPASIPAGEYVPTADQRVQIYNVPWSHFEEQIRLKGDAPVPRFAYLNGVLELMTPSKHHERLKSYIGCLIEAFALERGLDLSPYGGWLLKNQPELAGVEPDECYIIGSDQSKEIPDLVIEVIWTHGGLDKLEIYRRLGIREVWVWKGEKIFIYSLEAGRYVQVAASLLLPGLDLRLLTSFLDRPTALQAVRAFREALASPRRLRPSRRR